MRIIGSIIIGESLCGTVGCILILSGTMGFILMNYWKLLSGTLGRVLIDYWELFGTLEWGAHIMNEFGNGRSGTLGMRIEGLLGTLSWD